MDQIVCDRVAQRHKKSVPWPLFTPTQDGPPHLPQNLKKVGFKWGGGLGGPDQKLIGGCTYLTK